MIHDLIKKLRRAADALEELYESNPANNDKVAKKIRKSMVFNPDPDSLEAYARKHGERGVMNLFTEGFNMQAGRKSKAEWKAANVVQEESRLQAMAQGKSDQALAMAKKNNEPVLIVKRTRTKPHWTQTPEGRIKMGKAIKKMWAKKRAEKE